VATQHGYRFMRLAADLKLVLSLPTGSVSPAGDSIRGVDSRRSAGDRCRAGTVAGSLEAKDADAGSSCDDD